MTRPPETLRFGINYTPSRRWYFCWNDWNAEEIRADFQALQPLGLDHLRVQLIWPWFQPNPGFVSDAHLARLCELMHMADTCGFEVLVSVFTGFLSGYTFLPPNTTGPDVFTDTRVIEAEHRFLHVLLERLADCPNLMGLDLGNELNCLDHAMPSSVGDNWGRAMTACIKAQQPGMRVVNGVDHFPWMAGTSFSPAHLARDYDAACIHAWPAFSGCLDRAPIDQPPSLHLTAFYCQWARLFCAEQRTPLWIQEYGCSDAWGSHEARARYLRESMLLAVAQGASLFTLWCSHDKTTDMTFHPFEYHYGLLSPDNAEKPLFSVYRDAVTRCREQARRGGAPDYDAAIVLPDDFAPRPETVSNETDWLARTLKSDFWQVYDLYLKEVARGCTPALVRARDLSTLTPAPGTVIETTALLGR